MYGYAEKSPTVETCFIMIELTHKAVLSLGDLYSTLQQLHYCSKVPIQFRLFSSEALHNY